MTTARSIRAGRAHVEMSLRDGKVKLALAKMQQRLLSLAKLFAGLGVAAVAAAAATGAAWLKAAKVFAKVGDEVDKISARTGLSAEFISALGFAAEQSGQDMGTLEKAVQRMQKSIVDASNGLSTPIRAFEALGLSAEQLINLSPEQQFATLADAIARIENPTIRTAVAMDIFGRSGSKLLPLLGDYNRLAQQAKGLGIVISQDEARSAADLTDAFNRLNKQLRAIVFSFGAIAASPIVDMIDAISPSLRRAIDTVKNLDVVWTSLRATWDTTTTEIFIATSTFIGSFDRAWSRLGETLLNTIDQATGELRKTWESTMAFMEKSWLRVQGLITGDVSTEIEKVNRRLARTQRGIDRETNSRTSARSEQARRERADSLATDQRVETRLRNDLKDRLKVMADEIIKSRMATEDSSVKIANAVQGIPKAGLNAARNIAKAAKTAAAGRKVALAPGDDSFSSRGIFNPAAIAALSNSGPAEETAKNTKATELEVRKVVRHLKASGVII